MRNPIFAFPLKLTLAALFLAGLGGISAQQPGLGTTPTPFVAYSNGVLPITQPGSSTGWSIENAFVDGGGLPSLDFVDPMGIVQVPGTSGVTAELVVVQKNGRIYRFFKNPAQYGDGVINNADLVTVLDVSANTQTDEDQGFYTLVFHPNFGQSGQVGENYAYVCYNHRPTAYPNPGPNASYWRVSRFTWLPGSGTLDAGSEYVFINQFDPQRWHNGGAMFFDNEGFLNISTGDGEFDYWHQNENGPIDGGFFGGILRIDVNGVVAGKSHAIRRDPIDIPATATGGLPADPAHARPAGWPASYTQGYGIPNTNPWQDSGAVYPNGIYLEEFVVHGLRSPHTVSYDPMKNQMWCGDVGGGAREELSRFVLGDNAQWPIREGINGGNEPAGSIGAWTPPVIDYGHGGTTYNGVTMNGASIIGGMRYRGAKWNATFGTNTVLFGDITVGKIWAITLDEMDVDMNGNEALIVDGTSGEPLVELIASQGIKNGGKSGLANFCTDEEGEIYLMELNGTNNTGGRIKKLVTAGIAQEPPLYLSATGLFAVPNTPNSFSPTGDLPISTGVIPFDVANPLWSDAAHKKRWIALPNNGSHNTPAEQIAFDDEYNWVFPEGTVIIKHFELDTDLDPAVETIRRLETRLIVCTENGGKYGITYKWNAARTDAVRMGGAGGEPDGLAEPVPMFNNGTPTTAQNWDFPSRSQCLECHNQTSGQALGVRTTQLNMDYHYDSTGITSNQLLTYNALGMFDQTLTPTQLANYIESRPVGDDTAPVEHRVRSYLDSNCSHCHQPGGIAPFFEARLGTPLTHQGIINVALSGHNSGLFPASGREIKPNDIPNSIIHTRLNSADKLNGIAMPPLAKNLVDQDAVALVANYISSINDADFAVTAPAKARYVRLTGLSEVNGNIWTSVAEFQVLNGSGNPIPGITVVDYDSQAGGGEAAASAVDGDNNTHWHSNYGGGATSHPHYITVDLGALQEIGGYRYTPRQGNQNGRIANYEVHYTTDSAFTTNNWARMDSGTWANNATVKTFNGPITGIRKARCEIAGPTNLPGGGADIEVTVVFDSDVNDFIATDLQVAGGTVTALRGSGYYYVATITPSQTAVSVQVPADVANTTLLGNLASNSLQIGDDIFGPVASFTGVPQGGLISAPVTLGIVFDEVPTGFSAGSLSATNATLSGFSGSGQSYSILVTPVTEGSIAVTLNKAGITDSLSNPMANSVTANLTYASEILLVEAEGGTLAGSMVAVNDGSASGGSYIVLPNDGGTPEIFNPANSATYTFILPNSGNWILEGLIRAANTSSNSLWVKIDGGPTYHWDTHVSATFQWDQLNSVPSGLTTLIGPGISNGDFTLLGGIASTAKATHWDTDPDGDVDNWKYLSGPAGDSGTEMDGANRIAFFQAGNHAFNITDTPHVIATGDVINFSYADTGGGNVDVQLGAWDGNTVTPGITLFGTQSISTGNGTFNGVQYTVTSGDTGLLGKTLTLVAGSTGQFYPHLDDVVLTVTSNLPPIDPLVLSLASGSHTVTVYGREAGTQLDSLRFVLDGPPAITATLNAPATVDTGYNVNVSVNFSTTVTGLTTSDFIITGANSPSLTGSGSSYVLTVTPTGSTVQVTLPANSVVEGNSVSNTVTTTVTPPSITQVEAEAGTLTGGMVTVADAGASNGSYIWLPEGTAPGNENSFNAANSATFTFDLPHAGNWILQGLVSADSATSDSFWVRVDGAGTIYDWDLNELLSGFNWQRLNHNQTATTTLIGAGVSNGDFERVAGATGPLAKVAQWDGIPDIDNWRQFSGPANDSGTDDTVSTGVREAFFQGGNHAFNETTTAHTIAVGDVINFSFARTSPGGRGAAEAQLAHWDGSTVGSITTFGPLVTSGTVNGVYAGSYPVTAADTALIGKKLTIVVGAPTGSNYPEVDNVILTVTSNLPPQDPVILNLTAGTHTVTVYAKEDGARLDALRFVSDSPTVTLTAPAVVISGNNFNVNVAFSESVTGLVSGDFTVNGATVSALTGSGASYTLTLTPTASSVNVTLPAGSVVDGDTNGNIVSNTLVITIRTAFEQWAIDHGLPGPVNYADDTNNDGLTLLQEVLLNIDPNTYGAPTFDGVNPTGLPVVTAADFGGGVRRLRIEFPRNAAAVANGYQYIGQFSDNMVTWENVAGGTTVGALGSGWDHVRIDDTQTTSTKVKRFGRLKLVSP